MFSPLFIVYILITLVGLVVLSFIYKQYKNIMLEYYCMNIFELRDELFDYAASGNISFNDESYQLVRTLLNGYLKYAENLDIYRFQRFQKAVVNKKLIIDNYFIQQYNLKSKALNVEQKEKLDKCLKQSAITAATYMIRKSIIYCSCITIKTLFFNWISYKDSKLSWKYFRCEKVETINRDLVTDIYEVGANAS